MEPETTITLTGTELSTVIDALTAHSEFTTADPYEAARTALAKARAAYQEMYPPESPS